MTVHTRPLISIVIPVHNESANLQPLHQALTTTTANLSCNFEFIFVDDGSVDDSVEAVKALSIHDSRVRLLEFARNFGKEAAVSAGLHAIHGDAAIVMDADLQHPPSLISKFIEKWKKGADVVIGVREYDDSESWFKKLGSKWFYRILKTITSTNVVPHSTDYRLIDKCVVKVFNRLTERNRMTRGLIDWLGFRRAYVKFQTPPRLHGNPTYSYRKLFGLAFNSFTSHSLLPLRLAGYLGAVIIALSVPINIFIYVEQYAMGDPLGLNITGTALLAFMLLFLVGLILVCMGLVALYIARIHIEVANRPLYIVREREQVDLGPMPEEMEA